MPRSRSRAGRDSPTKDSTRRQPYPKHKNRTASPIASDSPMDTDSEYEDTFDPSKDEYPKRVRRAKAPDINDRAGSSPKSSRVDNDRLREAFLHRPSSGKPLNQGRPNHLQFATGSRLRPDDDSGTEKIVDRWYGRTQSKQNGEASNPINRHTLASSSRLPRVDDDPDTEVLAHRRNIDGYHEYSRNQHNGEAPNPTNRPRPILASSSRVDYGSDDDLEEVSHQRDVDEHSPRKAWKPNAHPTRRHIPGSGVILPKVEIDSDNDPSPPFKSQNTPQKVAPKPQTNPKQVSQDPKPSPAAGLGFGLSFPVSRLPESIRAGCSELSKFYANHGQHGGSISTCVEDMLSVIDYQDPTVELAIIIVMVLGCPSPLPKVDYREGFQEHKKRGREKAKWRAVLFVKMMWFRYRALMKEETVKMFTSFQAQQNISAKFLIDIGWVVYRQSNRGSGCQYQNLGLVSKDSITRKLSYYKRLIDEGESLELATHIFKGDDDWGKKAVEHLEDY